MKMKNTPFGASFRELISNSRNHINFDSKREIDERPDLINLRTSQVIHPKKKKTPKVE